jgi:hypothetical protein
MQRLPFPYISTHFMFGSDINENGAAQRALWGRCRQVRLRVKIMGRGGAFVSTIRTEDDMDRNVGESQPLLRF